MTKYKKNNYTRTCSQTFPYEDLRRLSPARWFKVWEDACLEEEDLVKQRQTQIRHENYWSIQSSGHQPVDHDWLLQ